MGTPPDREGQGEGWQSSWQQPRGDQPWQQPGAPAQGSWQQAPDGSWVKGGGQQTSGKSTAALVLGIVGLVLCPLICSVLALVFGYKARREIDESGGRLTGRGNATAGVVLGWIGVAFSVLFIAFVVWGASLDSEPESSPSDAPTVLVAHPA